MAYQKILYEVKDGVAVISMNDPKLLNAASFEMTEELNDAFARASDEARAVILTGIGRGFCSGANLGGDFSVSDPNYDAGAPLDTLYNPLVRRVRGLTIPLVTAVNGPAAGIGAALGLAGDIIIAGASAYFLEAFCRVGLVPDGGSAYLLTHAAGRVRAMELMMLGEKLPAAKALEWGLVTRVVPDETLFETALNIASSLANGPTRSLGLIKRLGWLATETAFETMLETERQYQKQAGRSADHAEGVAAFREKRATRFTGD